MFKFEPEKIKALLIGVGEFPRANGKLDALPQVEDTVVLLEETLINENIIGVPQRNITTLINKDLQEIREEISKLGNFSDEDVLLFYYVGHGDVNSQDSSYQLTASDTAPNLPPSYLSYNNDVKNYLKQSRAKIKIIIIDSCFSARAIDTHFQSSVLNAETLIKTQLKWQDKHGKDAEGTYILVSAPHDRVTHFPSKLSITPFTKDFCEILLNGIDNDKEFIELDDIFFELENKAPERKKQNIVYDPSQLNTLKKGPFYFAKNQFHATIKAQIGEKILAFVQDESKLSLELDEVNERIRDNLRKRDKIILNKKYNLGLLQIERKYKDKNFSQILDDIIREEDFLENIFTKEKTINQSNDNPINYKEIIVHEDEKESQQSENVNETKNEVEEEKKQYLTIIFLIIIILLYSVLSKRIERPKNDSDLQIEQELMLLKQEQVIQAFLNRVDNNLHNWERYEDFETLLDTITTIKTKLENEVFLDNQDSLKAFIEYIPSDFQIKKVIEEKLETYKKNTSNIHQNTSNNFKNELNNEPITIHMSDDQSDILHKTDTNRVLKKAKEYSRRPDKCPQGIDITLSLTDKNGSTNRVDLNDSFSIEGMDILQITFKVKSRNSKLSFEQKDKASKMFSAEKNNEKKIKKTYDHLSDKNNDTVSFSYKIIEEEKRGTIELKYRVIDDSQNPSTYYTLIIH